MSCCLWCAKEVAKECLHEFLFHTMDSSWRLQAEKDLSSCFDCVQRHHELLESAVREKPDMFKQKDLFQKTASRVTKTLKSQLKSMMSPCKDVDSEEWFRHSHSLVVSLKESLKYPRLLLDRSLHDAFVEGLLVALSKEEEEEADLIADKLPGVYLLLVHPVDEVC